MESADAGALGGRELLRPPGIGFNVTVGMEEKLIEKTGTPETLAKPHPFSLKKLESFCMCGLR